MKKGQDWVAEFSGLVVIHQKIPGREVGRHRHDEHEFFLPLQGEVTLVFPDQKVQGGAGRILYSPPDTEHAFSSSASGEGERVILLVHKDLWKSYEGKKHLPASLPVSALVRELVFFILLHPKHACVHLYIEVLIRTLDEQLNEGVPYLGDLEQIFGKISDSRIKKAIQIGTSGNRSQLSIESWSKKAGMSVRNFSRLFLEELGMTPKQFQTVLKINQAKTLLVQTQMTITDIAFEVGYSSLPSFVSSFQKLTGKLPSEFRLDAVSRGLTPERCS
jgi:AraC-like DNA-binding protein